MRCQWKNAPQMFAVSTCLPAISTTTTTTRIAALASAATCEATGERNRQTPKSNCQLQATARLMLASCAPDRNSNGLRAREDIIIIIALLVVAVVIIVSLALCPSAAELLRSERTNERNENPNPNLRQPTQRTLALNEKWLRNSFSFTC